MPSAKQLIEDHFTYYDTSPRGFVPFLWLHLNEEACSFVK